MTSTPIAPRRPKVIFWYTMYRIALLCFYLLEVAGGLLFLTFPDLLPGGAGSLGPLPVETVLGVYYLGAGLLEGLLVIISFLMSRTRTAYAYHLVVMALSMMNGVFCLGAVIPLLIFWVRPEVQAYFGWSTELDGVMRQANPTQSPPGPDSSHT